MKKYLIVLTILCSYVSGLAQQRAGGFVTDAAKGQPLEGASVMYNDKSVGLTAKDGSFSFACEGPGNLVISYVGYQSYRRRVRGCGENIRVQLIPLYSSLEKVEITATANANKELLYQANSLTKLEKPELKRGTGLFFDDAINANVPGVSMNRRSVSAGQQFNIRGYGNGVGFRGANNNFDGLGYKVYLNGIPITDAEGITLMDDIDFGSVGNVEISKGPSGTVYGLAIAGVVNLETIKPEKGQVTLGQDLLIGNYGLRRFTTHFAAGLERSSLLVSYGNQESSGFMPHNASHKDFINITASVHPNTKQSFNGYFGYTNSYDQRAGELTIAQYNNKDYSGNPAYIKNNAHSEVIGFRAGFGHTYLFNDWLGNTTTVFAAAVTNNSSSAGGWTDKDPLNLGLRSTFQTKFQWKKGIALSGITGIETQRQQAQTIGYAMIPDSSNLTGYNRIGNLRSNQYTISATTSLFTEWTLGLKHDLSLTAGIGFSHMLIELNDRFFTGNYSAPKQYRYAYDWMASPHLAINKVFHKQVSVYIAYSKGFKAPVSSQFFIPATGQLNLGLKPESGNQFEIGTKGGFWNQKFQYQLAVFSAVFRDKMTAIAVTSGSATLYTYTANSGNQVNKGVEFSLRYKAYESVRGFLRGIRPFGNLTYSDFTYDGYKYRDVDYTGKAVAGVSRFTANLGADLQAVAGLYANLVYSYKDRMPITSDGVNWAHGYNLLNGKIGIHRNLSAHWEMDAYAGVSNITQTKYYIMVFINQLPDAYIPAPAKANYFGGFNLKYHF